MNRAVDAPRSLIFESLETRLAPLERLPRGVWLASLTHSRGMLEPRLAALEHWREALLAGRVPWQTAARWPGEPLATSLCETLERLGLQQHCMACEPLAEAVVQSLLFHVDLIVDYEDRGEDEPHAIARALAAFEQDWVERSADIDALIEIFGDPGDLLKNCRWDMLRGLLRSSDWESVVRIRALIEGLPELTAIIRRLGRAIDVADPAGDGQPEQAMSQLASALHPRARTVHVPELPGETRGVCRSERFARMLPSESIMFMHPRLRLVWHARHAERALLTYEDDDRMQALRHEQAPTRLPGPRPAPRREMGPMLVCVDTSASMRGGAERVAKAVVLEVARVAHAQRRACHVFAFGGPDEIVELDLAMDERGLMKLARFLAGSFQGGTDICGPLERVLERLGDSNWQLADLLIASDGEFGTTPSLAERVNRARDEAGLRVQGILIGDRETIGLLEITDDVFWVRDWRRFGGSDGASPVHSSSLTASYFPGALRNRQNRDATVSGSAVSDAMRISGRAYIPRDPV
ncbi:VWA domain-containing protein [Rhodocyclaceae bacterium SMB388]